MSEFSTTTLSVQGELPLKGTRIPVIGAVPDFGASDKVKIVESTHILTYVQDLDHISTGPLSAIEVVKAWEITNGILTVKAILKGGNLVSIVDQSGKEYVWLNKEGAVNYGAGSNAFPLTRGLILHGGIRVAAVSAEHGLYYDSDWDISFEKTDTSATITLSITDDEATRATLADTLSVGQYCAPGNSTPFSKYPVTDAKYVYQITLKDGEDFVRLYAGLVTPKQINAEIWLPQTYPINANSQIISHQKKRRVKDTWVYQGMILNKYLGADQSSDVDHVYPSYKDKGGVILSWPATNVSYDNANLAYPLQWPNSGGGILYDYPYREGDYHAVSYGDGSGAAYVTKSTYDVPHYTKMWGWGNPALFNRDEALKQNPPLAAGRPKAEYYEPWGSAFNTGFFELNTFSPGQHGWEAYIVPFASGLENGKSQEELQNVIDTKVATLPKIA